MRSRQGTSSLQRPLDLQIVGDEAADLKVLQPGIREGHVRYRISVGSRRASDSFLRAFRWTGMPVNLNCEIQIISGVLEALPGSLRIVTKELKDVCENERDPLAKVVFSLYEGNASRLANSETETPGLIFTLTTEE